MFQNISSENRFLHVTASALLAARAGFHLNAIKAISFVLNQYTLPTGDANRDGTTDASDYVLWRNEKGILGPLLEPFKADFDANGTVDNSDYQIWRANFGRTRANGKLVIKTKGILYIEPL